jgi:hypothetical protein
VRAAEDIMSVLFVTSFAPDMYRTTGMHLIESFRTSGTEGRVLVCHEGNLGAELAHASPWVELYDLDHSPFLAEWLARHQSIIPRDSGGLADPCDCQGGTHRPRCHWDWYNRNAFRWFRKLVALDHALSLDDWSYVIWVDSDCRFTRQMTTEKVREIFGGHSVVYLRGQDRPVIESGVIGFKRDPGGLTVLRRVIERYRTDRFAEDDRWDDGYQFQLAIDEYPDIRSADLATRSTAFDYVVPGSPFGPYLDHFKGVHGMVLRLMR